MTRASTDHRDYETQAWEIDHVNWRDGDDLRPRVAELIAACEHAMATYGAWADAVVNQGARYQPGRHQEFVEGLVRWLGETQVALAIAARCEAGGYPVARAGELAKLAEEAVAFAVDGDPLGVFIGIALPSPDSDGNLAMEFDLGEK